MGGALANWLGSWLGLGHWLELWIGIDKALTRALTPALELLLRHLALASNTDSGYSGSSSGIWLGHLLGRLARLGIWLPPISDTHLSSRIFHSVPTLSAVLTPTSISICSPSRFRHKRPQEITKRPLGGPGREGQRQHLESKEEMD